MITKDDKSLITQRLSGKLIKTSLNSSNSNKSNKNELIHPVSDNNNKSNHSLITRKISSDTKLISPAKVIELDEKNGNTNRKRSINAIVMNDIKKQRRQSQLLAKKLNLRGSNAGINDKDIDNLSKTDKGCRFTLVFDPNGRFSWWIGAIVSLAVLYNFWVIIYRFSFSEINQETQFMWMIFDYTADTLYILDIIFNFHTGFLEEGVLQTDPIRIRHHYMNTTRFYVDCLCLLPLDILYLSFGYQSIFRCFRLVKIYKLLALLERTERHFSYPNLFQSFVLLKLLFFIFHWNACITHLVSKYLSNDLFTNSNLNSYQDLNYSNSTNPLNLYLKEFYSSIKLLTLVTAIPNPTTNQDYIYSISQLLVAIILFAYIMGHVGHIVNNLSNARKEFQSKLDAVKRYMSIRRVPKRLQTRVIKWFDFLWLNRKSADDNQILNLLPYKLRAEIAIHVHLDTLKRVEIFQNTEAGFLNELVLRLKPVLFSPGDFICRKGEVGKEMYIVNSGKLQVMSDNGKIILATLKAGSYFGEISILNMGAHGNRRTASVKSVGYSDLFCLSKEDLWEVLKEYPAVRVKLEAIAVKRLEKHKKPLAEIINLSRSKSMSCLDGKNKIVNTELKRHCTLPTSLLKRTDISLLYTNSSSHIKFKSNTKTQLANKSKNDNQSKSYASEIGIMNESIQLINRNNEINYTPNIPICNEIVNYDSNNNSNNNSKLNNNVYIGRTKSRPVVLDLKRSESDLKSNLTNNQLMQEIEKLKRMVDCLKDENDNLKREKHSFTKPSSYSNSEHQDIEIQMELND